MGDRKVRIAHNAQRFRLQLCLQLLRKRGEGCGWEGGLKGIIRGDILLPTQGFYETQFDVVGERVVNRIVQAKDHHVVLFNEVEFFFIDRVVGEGSSAVAMVVKGWFVGDHQVESALVGLAQNLHRIEESGCDAGYRGSGVSRFDGVDSVGLMG